MGLLFAQGLLLPAYTITGFDASAMLLRRPSRRRRVFRAVLCVRIRIRSSGLDLAECGGPRCSETSRGRGQRRRSIPLNHQQRPASANWCCAHRRDYPGPIPMRAGHSDLSLADGICVCARWRASILKRVRWVCPRRRSPPVAIWGVAGTSVLFTLYTPVYATITAVCTIFLYVSYVLPISLGAWAYGRTWTDMGPWNLGRWYRPLAVLSAIGCAGLILLGLQPPNERRPMCLEGLCWC